MSGWASRKVQHGLLDSGVQAVALAEGATRADAHLPVSVKVKGNAYAAVLPLKDEHTIDGIVQRSWMAADGAQGLW